MIAMDSIITVWKDNLKQLLSFYEKKRGNVFSFYLLLFLYFIVINIICYWLAMYTAFPELTRGSAGAYYYKVQFPVGILGALFDSLSFFVTIFIIRHALCSKKDIQYVAHLSLDLIIAILATFWVLFVFSFSGWLVDLTNNTPQILVERNAKYEGLLLDAVARPADNMRNIYFGLIMGVSAMIPTCVHLYMFLHSCVFIVFRQKVTIAEN
jgi:heme/copper-type cytochrome/quinol oxidase subunit 4